MYMKHNCLRVPKVGWFIPRADTAHMADLFVLNTVDQAEVDAKPSLFATPTFFHTVSGMDRNASANKGALGC